VLLSAGQALPDTARRIARLIAQHHPLTRSTVLSLQKWSSTRQSTAATVLSLAICAAGYGFSQLCVPPRSDGSDQQRQLFDTGRNEPRSPLSAPGTCRADRAAAHESERSRAGRGRGGGARREGGGRGGGGGAINGVNGQALLLKPDTMA